MVVQRKKLVVRRKRKAVAPPPPPPDLWLMRFPVLHAMFQDMTVEFAKSPNPTTLKAIADIGAVMLLCYHRVG